MRIAITDDIIMTSDPYNIILNKEEIAQSGKNAGKKRLVPFAFCPTVVQALQRALNEKMAQSTARSLNTLITDYNALYESFRRLLDADLEAKQSK